MGLLETGWLVFVCSATGCVPGVLKSGSKSLVCTLDAPDRRSPAFYPMKSQSPNSNALSWLNNAFRGSQHLRFSRNGADRNRGSVGECENLQPMGCLTLGRCCARRAAPLLRVLRSETNLLRPCWAPPVSGVVGVATPCSTTLEVGGAVSTKLGGRFRGVRFFGRAVGPSRTGDRPPECAVCGGWRRSRMRKAGSRGDQTAGKE